ncbi:DUF2147 domain-containing protein [Mucilaginibacter pocheonensis]|uniref:Uncharacterized protein (DUF2147 family) n=1 Tax=Mucilaginibacter pocheonensis TaxID=398050 RepID=A0ABU1TCS3_9SPHI|nr:DUF2147 domain-containing protein [Mucilaginibacter pocheonensis]MDR6943203.1 uncharacterized protein (DUF2147 family) [Mucilaginibacter pocheonensis]
MLSPKKYYTRLVLIILTMASLSIAVKAQTDKIEGVWYNDIKSAKIQISKGADGKFNGKIIWLKEPLKNGKPKTDEENKDEKLRSRPVIGLHILEGFVPDGADKYTDGKIYDPKNGKTYSCNITYKGKTLAIRGYIGVSLFGRTTTWERAE